MRLHRMFVLFCSLILGACAILTGSVYGDDGGWNDIAQQAAQQAAQAQMDALAQQSVLMNQQILVNQMMTMTAAMPAPMP